MIDDDGEFDYTLFKGYRGINRRQEGGREGRGFKFRESAPGARSIVEGVAGDEVSKNRTRGKHYL